MFRSGTGVARARCGAILPGCLEVSVSTSEQISDGASLKILNSGRKLENRDEGCPDGPARARVEIAGCFPIPPDLQLLSEIDAVVRIDGGTT